MDKTIEIVVVAMVILLAATVLLFLFQDRADSFGGFLSDQQENAECKVLETRLKNSCNCQDPTGPQPKMDEIKSAAKEKECSWATGSNIVKQASCVTVCS